MIVIFNERDIKPDADGGLPSLEEIGFNHIRNQPLGVFNSVSWIEEFADGVFVQQGIRLKCLKSRQGFFQVGEIIDIPEDTSAIAGI